MSRKKIDLFEIMAVGLYPVPTCLTTNSANILTGSNNLSDSLEYLQAPHILQSSLKQCHPANVCGNLSTLIPHALVFRVNHDTQVFSNYLHSQHSAVQFCATGHKEY